MLFVSECSLRQTRQCVECEETRDGIRIMSHQCVDTITSVPVQDLTRICSASADIQCQGPCYQCPTACVKSLRTECRVGHSLEDRVEVEDGVWKMVESVATDLQCEEREVEDLCAPINCRHVNMTSTCVDTRLESYQVEVRTRECPVCDQDGGWSWCHEVVTDDCNNHPLQQTWFKYCASSQQVSTHNSFNTFFEKFKIFLFIHNRIWRKHWL